MAMSVFLGVDLPNDLAIVRLDKHDAPFFTFDKTAMAGDLPKGERLYSMGNPLDLGFTIIEGTYNGLVERSYNDRVHFSRGTQSRHERRPDRQRRGACGRHQRRDPQGRPARQLSGAGAVCRGTAAERPRA